jgi:hypothetical protein
MKSKSKGKVQKAKVKAAWPSIFAFCTLPFDLLLRLRRVACFCGSAAWHYEMRVSPC